MNAGSIEGISPAAEFSDRDVYPERSGRTARPSRFARAAAASAIGLLAALYVVRLAFLMPHYGTDLDPIRFAARLLLRGDNPYETIGPTFKYFWNFRLLYPLPAVLLSFPLVAVPVVAARAVFVGAAGASLAFLITREKWWPLLVFASGPFWAAVGVAQWSPWLACAAISPFFGIVLAAKPNLGLAIMASSRTTRDFAIRAAAVTAICALSFLVMPGWIFDWLSAVRGSQHIRPLVTLLGGPIILLLVFRWRRPEARLLLALVLIPQNPALYEGLLVLLIPRSAIEALFLATSSWFVEPLVDLTGPHTTFVDSAIANGHALIILLYLPALAMVLRRPNAGPIPRLLEGPIRHLPTWLRGEPA